MKPVFVCDACGLGYANPKLALECEAFCKKNKSCSPEIAMKAVYEDNK